MGRTIVAGDVHGCLEELHALLASVQFEPGRDRLVSVGDLVAKGPHGAETVRFFREGGHRAVRGNHDERLLAWWRGERERPLGSAHAPDARRMTEPDWEWLAGRPLVLPLPEHGVLVVHAGLVPGVPLAEQSPRDLMNLRSIRPDGAPSKRVDEGAPWASLFPGPELVVFGHDAVRGLQQWPHAVGLDTGCVYGGALSAIVLPERRIVAVPARRGYVHPEGPVPS